MQLKQVLRQIVMILLLVSGMAMAAGGKIPPKSPEELCRERNASRCESNGLKFGFTEQECPRGTKTLKKLGHEDCDRLIVVASEPAVAPAMEKLPVSAVTASVSSAVEQEAGGFWSTPYFILALIGLLQGLISRASLGPLLVILGVMPLIGTWSIVSDAHFMGGVLANAAYIGMEWLGTFLFSLAGWAAGALVRLAAYRLLLR